MPPPFLPHWSLPAAPSSLTVGGGLSPHPSWPFAESMGNLWLSLRVVFDPRLTASLLLPGVPHLEGCVQWLILGPQMPFPASLWGIQLASGRVGLEKGIGHVSQPPRLFLILCGPR